MIEPTITATVPMVVNGQGLQKVFRPRLARVSRSVVCGRRHAAARHGRSAGVGRFTLTCSREPTLIVPSMCAKTREASYRSPDRRPVVPSGGRRVGDYNLGTPADRARI